jgi:hypothetical protein
MMNISSDLWRFAFFLALTLSGPLTVRAQALDKPTTQVILTITGNVSKTNGAGMASFDMKMLEKLPQKTFTTQTPWYPKPTTFTGPLLRDVLNAAGAKGTKLTAVALNDYKTEIPFSDALEHDVIIARLLNDRPMPVREKGPLFIVYPFDSKPALKVELFVSRSAWQLNKISVK